MNILLTGGAGYIGSHTSVVLSQAGHKVVLFDNFCNSKKDVLDRLQKILGSALQFVKGDIRDSALVAKILQEYKIGAVIHLAGLKAVGESTGKPIEYYSNNVQGSISLIKAMKSTNIKNLVFSSSATVYGKPSYLPIDENHPTSPTNPYGRSKIHTEEMFKDISNSDAGWKIICLRYFNPVGAHSSGLIGEDPNGIPNNLMPYISQVAAGKLSQLNIYGSDYPTKDGTGVRDYIHVMDLAEGHLAALTYLERSVGFEVFNLGTGNGFSVLEVLRAFEVASQTIVDYKITERRMGDVDSSYGQVDKALSKMHWEATRSLADMCESAWKFNQKYR